MKNLLKKWISGEVNWSKEKQLRQKAKNDPFLSDAMEGYDAFPESDHAATIERLKKRLPTAQKKNNRGIIPLYRVAAAAAVVGIIATFFWMQNELQQTPVLSDMAKTDKTAIENNPSVSQNAPIAVLEPKKNQSIPPTNNQPNTTENVTIKKEAVANELPISVNKPIVAKPKSTKRKAQQPTPAVIIKEENIKVAELENTEEVIAIAPPVSVTEGKTVIEPMTESMVEATVVLADEMEADIPVVANARSAPATASSAPNSMPEADGIKAKKNRSSISFIQGEPQYKTYLGTVKNQDGQPLEDVTIQALDTDNHTLSQKEGAFKLLVDSPIEYLIISRPGFNTRKVSINQYSDFFNIVLTQKSRTAKDFYDETSLSTSSKMTPRPKGGFLKFERYVDKNLVYPQEANEKEIEQDVEVRFFVNEEGLPTQFETQGNDEYGFEKEAIRLIKEGPKWKPANRDVIVIIRFELGE